MHDDFILADALAAKLDELEWSTHYEPFIVQAKDPLEEMTGFGRREKRDEGWMRWEE